jgi:hypothetical protein
MLPSMDGDTLLAKRQETFVIFAKMSDDVVLVEGASICGNIDSAAIHYSILL